MEILKNMSSRFETPIPSRKKTIMSKDILEAELLIRKDEMIKLLKGLQMFNDCNRVKRRK